MKVPLLDLDPQNGPLRQEILSVVTAVIDSNRYILGPEVERLEQAVAAYCGTGYGVGVSSGTDALLISLMALGVGPGDIVLTTPYSFFATMGSIVRLGAIPRFVDIEDKGMNIDPQAVAHALEQDRQAGGRIKAMIPVHLFGQCADMEQIRRLSEQYQVPVVEDAAQAIGASCPMHLDNGNIEWKKAGAMGLCGCFSFFPSKNLGGIGDGGMVVTADPEFAEKLRMLRNHGSKPKYYHPAIGGNFRLDPIQAAVLSVKLSRLEGWHQARRDNAMIYKQLFAASGLLDDFVRMPSALFEDVDPPLGQKSHIYNQFVIRVQQRDALRAHLVEHQVGCEVYYPLCLHQQECLHRLGFEPASYPVAEQAARDSLAIPVYPGISREQQEYVVATIAEFYRVA